MENPLFAYTLSIC